jgi:8-oxo-dGTP pyrophosphatase MutT (NUDIX family)
VQKATLLFLLREGKVLLIEKKRGIGAGFYNGPGGRIEEGETPAEAAVRELKEEVGLEARPEDLREAGLCHFFFGGEPFMDVWVFSAEKFSGEPVETEEAKPVWFDADKVPFERMWPDDKFWYQFMMRGERFEGTFWFNRENTVLLRHEISVIP